MSTIAAIHDLSGIGRCSLVTAISVLSTMGHQVFPLPTAILSKQTAFSGYSFLDFTPHMAEYLNGWEQETLQLDYIYTGFLGTAKQPELLSDYIAQHPASTVLIDPVMGDHGALYTCYEPSFIQEMKLLTKCAHILTPNQTEFCLLTDYPLKKPFPQNSGALLELCHMLSFPRLKMLVITGVSFPDKTCNILIDTQKETVHFLPVVHNGTAFSGTGDLFASVFCGSIANGHSPLFSANLAAGFISNAAGATPDMQDPRYGVRYEPFLQQLLP